MKVNAVIIREINDHEIEGLAQFAAEQGVIMRFIEFMPLDSGKAWMKELVVSGKEILDRLQARFQLDAVPGRRVGDGETLVDPRQQGGDWNHRAGV